MEEGPKLYVNKPKKAAQMKKFKGIEPKSSNNSTISSYYSTGSSDNGSSGVSKPPEIPKESFAKRFKFMWPLLLTVNFTVGAYLLTRTKKKDETTVEENINATLGPSLSTSNSPPTAAPITDNLPTAHPVRVLDPIPEDQQRELFKWMLEEKRKIKTNDPAEKKRIDEEKAILKQFIRAKSIPSL